MNQDPATQSQYSSLFLPYSFLSVLFLPHLELDSHFFFFLFLSLKTETSPQDPKYLSSLTPSLTLSFTFPASLSTIGDTSVWRMPLTLQEAIS